MLFEFCTILLNIYSIVEEYYQGNASSSWCSLFKCDHQNMSEMWPNPHHAHSKLRMYRAHATVNGPLLYFLMYLSALSELKAPNQTLCVLWSVSIRFPLVLSSGFDSWGIRLVFPDHNRRTFLFLSSSLNLLTSHLSTSCRFPRVLYEILGLRVRI